MNLKVLFMLLLYWFIWISFISFTGSTLLSDAGYNLTAPTTFNNTDLTANESGTGGIFSTGISFGRYFTLVAFGVGLGGGAPAWMSFMFVLWQSAITIFTVGFIISSIWNG